MSIEKERVGEIVHSLMDANLEQLRTINKMCVREIKERKKDIAKEMANKLSSGDIVVFTNTKKIPKGTEGVVTKVKRTRADVTVDGNSWDVPLTCLKKKNN